MLPQARQNNLLVRELMDELVVYDQERAEAHNLNRTAAFVRRLCDGHTSVPEMAATLQREFHVTADEALVWLTWSPGTGASTPRAVDTAT